MSTEHRSAIMPNVDELLRRAARLAQIAETWADLSNAICHPFWGLIARTFPAASQRRAFRRTPAYEALMGLIERKMRSTGLIEGAQPQASINELIRQSVE